MAKETYYFSHDSNAITDTKILNMRADYGLEGYGLFWVLIEMMRNEEGYKLELNKNTYKAIKILSSTNIDVEKFVKNCIEDYKLFEEDEGYFYSRSLLNRMLEYERKKEINRKNGKLGGRPKKETEKKPMGFENKTEQKPIALQNKTEKNQSKGKENKIKENKIKENKEKNRKEVKEIYNQYCSNLPQVQKITEKREKAIEKFLKEFTKEQFIEICKIANSSDFLIGKNKTGWKADFDFLMRIDKATSVLEGKYSNLDNLKNTLENKKETQEEAIARKTRELEEALRNDTK